MPIAQNKGAGMNVGPPDVCITPPADPRRVHEHRAQLDGGEFLREHPPELLPAFNLATNIPITLGDDPGTLGPGPKRVGEFVSGSPKVYFNGLQAIRHTSPTTGNAKNVGGSAEVPSATNVILV